MPVWNEIIFSGSDAQVASLDIFTPESGPDNSLEVDDGRVLFDNLPLQYNNAPIGKVMKSSLNNWVFVSNDYVAPPTADYNIPFNYAGFDYNGDGTIGTSDLLEFLTQYGSTVTPGSGGDFDNNGEIGSGDLLGFLIAFDEFTDFGDTRPEIIWENYDWIADNGYITLESVQNYYDLIGETEFWELFGVNYTNPSTAEGYTVLEYIEDSNPPAYDDDEESDSYFPYTKFDIFKYIYFTQTDGGVWGGHTLYSAPIGYPV